MSRGVKGEFTIGTVWYCVDYCAVAICNKCWLLLVILPVSLFVSFPFWGLGMDIAMDLRYKKSFCTMPETTLYSYPDRLSCLYHWFIFVLEMVKEEL